jgi:hypothetical protein
VQLRPEDDGEARIYYAPKEYATVRIQSGQSAVVAQPIGAETVHCVAGTVAV